MSEIADMFPEAVVPKIDENRRYTTRAFMHFIKRVAGVSGWDLDAAADQESHHAPRWFAAPGDVAPGAAAFDGLLQSWLPPLCQCATTNPPEPGWSRLPHFAPDLESRPWSIFINPPFDDIGPWLAKVWATVEQARGLARAVRIAFVMPGNRTEQGLWQDHVEPFLEGHDEAGRLGYQLVAHSPRTRQFYGHPGNPEPKSGQAEWPSVVLIWRRA